MYNFIKKGYKFIFYILTVLSILYSKKNNQTYVKSFILDRTLEIKLNYLLSFPDNYDVVNKPYPLVLFLHGLGERGKNIELVKFHGIPKLINEGKQFPFITLAPQCPSNYWWSDQVLIDVLIALIENLKLNLNIDSHSIYVTGLSMGGYGTLEIAMERPDLFAGIIPICGGGDLKKIGNLQDTPIWLFHGDSDMVVPVENSIKIYDILKPINQDAKITIYDNVGHDSWTETYENDYIYKWLLSHRK